MAKKRKKKKVEGYDPAYWNKRYLKELETSGKFMGMHKYTKPYGSIRFHESRYRKFHVPKWIHKVKDKWLLNDYVRFHETNLRFPNNEERILAIVENDLQNTVKEIATDSVIDYKNISRYLKKMEKKGLVKIEPDYKYKHMKSGRLKEIHTKRVRPTKKGKALYLKLYKW